MYHKVIIVGNLGGDPEMRYTSSNQAVTSFSVATNRQYTNSNGEKIKETVWFRVSVWGKMAETVNNYLRRGSKVLVEGRLSPDKATGGPRTYQRNDGSWAASYEITADNVRFLSTRSEDEGYQGGGGGQGSYTNDGGFSPEEDDDIPF